MAEKKKPEAEEEAKDQAAEAEEKPKRKRRPAAKKKTETKAKKDDAKDEAKADEAEEKPKPKRTRKKKADEEKAPETKAEDEEAEAEAKDEEAEEEPSADEVAAKAKPDEVDKRGRRRRGGEATAGRTRKPAGKRAESADGDGKVIVRAKARYVRTAPRKARLVVDHIRGKSVDEARAILIHTPRAASRDVLKLLDSAIANAENNHELVADELKIDRVFVDEGPTLKRFRPRALGRATQIRKRTSHMTILLTPKE
jgi:ribosomal protein L22